MQTLWQDIRYGLRMLGKSRGFAAIAVLTLALGIGANTAIFSFINALFLQPPNLVEKPDEIVSVLGTYEGRLGDPRFSYPDYLNYRDHNSAFSDVAARGPLWLYLSLGDTSTEVYGLGVSSNYFSMLGVKPMLGRFFVPEEDAVPGRDAVAVLSHDFWQRQFAGDPNIIGQSIRMNQVSFTVIGIAPKGFRGLYAGSPEHIWIPTAMAAIDRSRGLTRKHLWLDMVGRLNPERTIEEAGAELKTMASQLEAAYPETNKNLSVSLEPLKGMQPSRRDGREKQSSLLMAVVACALLIACVNLAGLLLARGTARSKEIAIRLALGAGRVRLMRQLMTESLTLSLLGGAAGLLVAYWIKDSIGAFFSYDFVELTLAFDPRVLGYAFVLSIITGAVFGLAPALQATSFNLVTALKDSTTGSYRQSRLRAALVVAQVALSFVLLVSAGLLIQSIRNVVVNPGYDSRNIAHFRLSPGRVGYDAQKSQAYHRELISRLEALPGVQTALVSSVPPDRGWGPTAKVSLPGQIQGRPEDAVEVEQNSITPRFLEALDIPLLGGRNFDERDRDGAPLVTIINETLARRFWPDQDPLGFALVIDGKEHGIIGIAKDIHPRRSDEPPLSYLYRAYWQSKLVNSRLLVRVAGDSQAMIPLLRREMLKVDPDVNIGQEMTLTERTARSHESERLVGSVLIYSGLLSLLLSAIGLYGVLAQAVNQRTREIGIRCALGAQVNSILRLVMGQGLRLIMLGLAVGLVAALALTRVLSSYLYGITANDPLTLVGISLSLMIVALLACWIPARRATKVDPIVALRYE